MLDDDGPLDRLHANVDYLVHRVGSQTIRDACISSGDPGRAYGNITRGVDGAANHLRDLDQATRRADYVPTPWRRGDLQSARDPLREEWTDGLAYNRLRLALLFVLDLEADDLQAMRDDLLPAQRDGLLVSELVALREHLDKLIFQGQWWPSSGRIGGGRW